MLITTVVVIVGVFFATLISDSRPVLGLDLQGGISIVLFPVKGTDLSSLNTAVTVIRNRVDGLGIAEPDVQRQGNTIVVNLPGVKDRTKAEGIVGETAELRFRPVEYQGENPLIIPWTAVPETTTTGTGTTTTGTGPTTTNAAVNGSSTTKPAAQTSTSGKAASRSIATAPIVARSAADPTTTGGASSTTKANTSTTKPGSSTTTTGPPAGETSCETLIKKSPPDTAAA